VGIVGTVEILFPNWNMGGTILAQNAAEIQKFAKDAVFTTKILIMNAENLKQIELLRKRNRIFVIILSQIHVLLIKRPLRGML
jgi:hypothetical protein